MPLRLEYFADTKVPVELDGVLPETLAGKSLAEIERLPIQHGNEPIELAQFFRVTGQSDDETLELVGELRGVHRIGAKMTRGTIQVFDSAGRHLGSEMRGGEIIVANSAGDWLGAEMRGGKIEVGGDAADHVGGAYAGSKRGMRGGTILVKGRAGKEVGRLMRRGLIAIGGNVGELAGCDMLAGTLVLGEGVRDYPGSGMKRGTILALAPTWPLKLLPSFRRGCRSRPVAVDLVLRELARLGFGLPENADRLTFDWHHGDLLAGGRGEILSAAPEFGR